MTASAPQRPLVLAVVGTDHHPFDRLVSWMDDWSRSHDRTARVVVQYGTSTSPAHADGHRLLGVGELGGLMQGASAIVCHGGPGTIMAARDAGVVPICVPRQRGFGEHVDDHQVRFVRRVAEDGLVTMVTDPAELDASLESALSGADGTRLDPVSERSARTVARFSELVDELVRRI